MSGFQDLSVFPVKIQQRSVSKEEVSPEQQESGSSMNQEIAETPYLKEEPEELRIRLEGKQNHWPKYADVIKFTFVPVPMKIEEDEENPQSSQVHHRQSEQVESGADGEDCGGGGAVSYNDPERYLQPEIEVKIEESSEAETDDSADWMETTYHQSGLNLLEDNEKGEIDSRPHSGEKLFGCSQCGQRFNLKQHLSYHMRSHTGEKPFSCSECGKRFSLEGSLITHMRIHSGEKPFDCSECGKRFSQNGNLTRHMLVHTRQELLSSAENSKEFNLKDLLMTHKRPHTAEKPFSCSECGKSFKEKHHLSTHMLVHTKQKLFGCLECGKRFTQKIDVTRHMLIHTRQKPFLCSECGRRFNRQSSVTRHMLLHTRQETETL
ncbi:gastrula zinc finger protein XlCGF8.2DB-like isoform X1 [Cheilinus undulatus]|uniref:gastrula zinc finger protein XlCGF8.2DB-like isoform X1 n=2 Tax=Cheilinus undulatus TaxID=241271 RepID=UPI001BD46BDF|nr:gastrula zinc finger protein XlCGF8.2DB-like isoform X1 [Cheilinus undulatus]